MSEDPHKLAVMVDYLNAEVMRSLSTYCRMGLEDLPAPLRASIEAEARPSSPFHFVDDGPPGPVLPEDVRRWLRDGAEYRGEMRAELLARYPAYGRAPAPVFDWAFGHAWGRCLDGMFFLFTGAAARELAGHVRTLGRRNYEAGRWLGISSLN